MGEPIRILVLEDDDELRDTLEALLTRDGHLVEVASRGQEAVQCAASQDFDLVIVDIRMEGMDGLEALEQVQQGRPEVGSLVITGYSSEADSVRALRLGVGDYLRKPFSLEDFRSAVSRQVARRRDLLGRQAAERSLRRTLVWAVESISRALEPTPAPLSGVAGAGSLAARLARALGLGPDRCEEIQLVALLAALRERSGSLDPGLELPPYVERGLAHLEERWDGQGGPEGLSGPAIPLESRAAALALAVAGLATQSLVGVAALLDPGAFEPDLVERLAGLEGDLPDPAPSSSRRRGLISLGQAWEEAGQGLLAAQAYESVGPEPSRERVEACLGLARLAWSRSQPASALEQLGRAVETAALLGPGAEAWACLEAGALAARAGHPASWGGRALELFARLQDETGENLARLTLGLFSPGADLEPCLERLNGQEVGQELSRPAAWLLRPLLERQQRDPRQAQARFLRRLVALRPQLVQGWLLEQSLDAGARAALSGCLDPHGQPELLRLLQGDPDPGVQRALQQAQPTSESRPLLRVHSMGPLEVFLGDLRVDDSRWKTQKIKWMFALLASHWGRPVSEDVLLECFWPGDLEKGKRNLYWSTSAMRRCLSPPGTRGESELVVRSFGSLRLAADAARWHDLEELEAVLRNPEGPAARRVTGLYRGPYLEGCYYDWALEVRARIDRQVAECLALLARRALQGENYAEGLEFGRLLLEVDPLRQEAHHAVMQALMRLGRPEEALRQFQVCERLLRQELGAEPGLPLLEARQRALLSLG